MELHLKIIGVSFIVLAIIHAGFPKYFNWKLELKSLSLMNKQMMEVHTFFIAFTVFLMGLLCFFSAEELVETNLGKKICLGFGVFWATRLVFQLFVYSSKLWKGKTFESFVHVFFTIFWVYLSAVFFKISFS